jgi:hypothetical protein
MFLAEQIRLTGRNWRRKYGRVSAVVETINEEPMADELKIKSNARRADGEHIGNDRCFDKLLIAKRSSRRGVHGLGQLSPAAATDELRLASDSMS